MALTPVSENVASRDVAADMAGAQPWAAALVGQGLLTAADLAAANLAAMRTGQRLPDVLAVSHGVSPLTLTRALAAEAGCPTIDPVQHAPDPRLVARWGASNCLRTGLLPWRHMGGCVLVLATRPETFARHKSTLADALGPVRMGLTTERQLDAAVCSLFAADLTHRAENKVSLRESSRNWNSGLALRWGLGLLAAVAVLAAVTPQTLFALLCIWALVTLLTNTGLKAAAAVLGLMSPPSRPLKVTPARLPKISLLIPLYKEREIAGHLLERLQAIDYPRELLDVCLIMETHDLTTRAALGVTNLPTWMRPITVPEGTLKTKPRALNFALDFAQGSIVGVYDAEDAPAPDQLRKVAQHFANRGPEVACLQGVLDYYNASANWLTRCFAVEYASWFRVVLPGLERMGLVVPLGGTTLFFRRTALEALGGWDAHNVTEDADLGVRLARHGYHTELIATVTEEEANGRVWPWIKQRSRWLKGYAITYAVHMRNPARLWRELGPRRFLGVQVLFGATLSQFVLAPVLWSFWVMPFGVAHPMAPWLNGALFWVVVSLFVLSELVNIVVGLIGVHKSGKRWLSPWVPTLHVYFPLAAIAAYKGLAELMWKPFFWDKTAHGVLLPKGAIPPPRPSPRQASDG